MDWNIANDIASTFQHTIASIAVIVGGTWAYFRFVRFRTLKPRVEFNIECSHSHIGNSDVLSIITVKLTNRGQTKINLRKIDLRENKRERCHLKYALVTDRCSSENVTVLSVPAPKLESLDFVFRSHEWVEPGETIDDTRVLKIKENKENRILALQIGVEVYGPIYWSTCTAFPLVGHDGSNSFESEDEQAEYPEAKAIREELKCILAKIRNEGYTNLGYLAQEINDFLRHDLNDQENLTRSQEEKASDLIRKAHEVISPDYYQPKPKAPRSWRKLRSWRERG